MTTYLGKSSSFSLQCIDVYQSVCKLFLSSFIFGLEGEMWLVEWLVVLGLATL